jgi:hypothetical protein
VFACPKLRVAVSVPPREAGVPPIVRVEFESDRAMVELVNPALSNVPDIVGVKVKAPDVGTILIPNV